MDRPQDETPGSLLENSLAEIGRALEALRKRLRDLEPRRESRAPGATDAASDVSSLNAGEPLAESDQAALAHLGEIISIPSTGPDANEVFSLAMDRVARLLMVDRAVLFLLDADRGRLRPGAARGFRRDDLSEFSLLPGEGLVGRAYREGRPLVHATAGDDAPRDPFIFRFPVRDAIALPLRAEGEVVGVLYAARRGRPAPFTVDEVRLLMLIADRVGTALVHGRLVDKIAGQVDRLRELVAVSARSSLHYDIGEILRSACDAGCSLLRVRCAAIAIAGPDGELVVRGGVGFPEGVLSEWRPRASEGLTGEMFTSRQPVVCPDLTGRPGPEDPRAVDLGVRSLLLIPLRDRKGVTGCLYLGDQSAKDFSADEIEAAQLLAAVAGIAVDNAQLYDDLRRAHDDLRATQEHLVQAERVRALATMAAGIAHEFNNILAIIVGKTQLMRERSVETSLREDLAVIEEAAWRAADTVRRLQGFAMTQIEEKLSAVDLNRVIEDAVSLTRPRWKDEAEARGVRIELATDVEDIPPVLGHAADLREMLTNLILNALDAMPDGGRLTLRTRKRQDAVELVLSDTGVGMPDDVRRRAFEPFFTTRSPQRAGLGLSMVHGIVARHKGSIEIESQEGQGATFWISLPTLRPIVAEPEPPAAPPGGPDPGSAAILVIDDESQIRRMLVDVLARGGHSVEAAPDGLDGLARFQRGRFDLVITDLSMPEFSGLEVTRAVKQVNPGTPVILITGWGDLLDPARLQQAGVDLTIVKPFRVEQVLSVVADALRLRRPPGP